MEGCDATIEADTEEAVMAQVDRHVADAHPDLELDDATLEAVRDAIEDA